MPRLLPQTSRVRRPRARERALLRARWPAQQLLGAWLSHHLQRTWAPVRAGSAARERQMQLPLQRAAPRHLQLGASLATGMGLQM